MKSKKTFKYCKANRAISILENRQLHFSYPSDLNDPEDCLIKVEFMGYPINYPVKEFAVLSLTELRDCERMWENYANNHTGICFGFRTALHENVIAFEFDDEKLPSLFGAPKGYIPIYPIKYSQDQLPPYQSPGGNPKRAFDFLVHKTPKWRHENEHRVILDSNLLLAVGKLDVGFKIDTLEEIILGKNISQNEREIISRIAAAKYPHATLIQA